MIDHKGRCQGRPCTCGAKAVKANLLRSQAMMGNQNARKHIFPLGKVEDKRLPESCDCLTEDRPCDCWMSKGP